jgi:putative Mn2+ efflux pump MntP
VRVIALLLAAVAVGLSNLAAAIGIGVTGVNTRVRLQVGLVFGVFEAGMPVVGLLIGQRFATEMDKAVRWPGAILLMIVGAQGLVRSIREGRRSAAEANRRPGTANPGAASPGSANLGSAHLGAVDLGAADLGAADLGAADLGTADRGEADPGTVNPGTADLGAADLGTADRGEADPGTVNPGTADPGTADPGAANLGEATPGAADAGVGRPGSGLSPGVSSLLASPSPRLGRLLATGLVLSMDNLVVGFALGTYGVSVAAGAILIGSISVAMSLVGLELGGLLGRWAGRRSEQMSGLILILVGAAIAGGALG